MPICPSKFLLKKNAGPEIFHVSCTKCDFDQKYEVAKNYTVYQNPDCDHADDPEVVNELPKVCPMCGAKLKKEKLPVKIWY